MNDKNLEMIAKLAQAIREKHDAGVSNEELESLIKTEIAKLQTEDASRKTVASDDIQRKTLEAHLTDPNPTEQSRKFQEANDKVYLLSVILGKNPRELRGFNELQAVAKSLYTSGASHGLEWIPTGFSNRLWEKIGLELKVANLFPQVSMPTNPYTSPVLTADCAAYLVAESTGDEIANAANIPPTQPTTGNFTLTAKKIAARVTLSDEVNEDSIIPVLPLVESNIVKGLATALENALINGDVDHTLDADNTTATDPRRAFDGLRIKGIDASSTFDFGSTTTINALRAMRAAMGVYGVNPADLVWITSIKGYLKYLLNTTECLTVDKYGMNATILSGELGKVDGIPIVVSEKVFETLDATGVIPSPASTYTEILLVNKNSFVLGNRGPVKVELGRDIANQQDIVVASMRRAFTGVYGTSAKAVNVGYNMA